MQQFVATTKSNAYLHLFNHCFGYILEVHFCHRQLDRVCVEINIDFFVFIHLESRRKCMELTVALQIVVLPQLMCKMLAKLNTAQQDEKKIKPIRP